MLLGLFLQIWNIKPGWGSRPDIHIEKSHSDDISCLKFSSDGRILLSRSFDGSLKVNNHFFRPRVSCCLLSSLDMYSLLSQLDVSSIIYYVSGLGLAQNKGTTEGI